MKSLNKNLVALTAIVVLSACGGGGGGASVTAPTGGTVTPPAPTQTAAAATLVTSVPAATYALNSPEMGAFTQLNAIRSQCGLGLIKQDTRLDAAAAAHTNYIANSTDPQRFGHTESAAYSFFTGVTPSDRTTATGYGPAASEIIGGNAYFTQQPDETPGKEMIRGTMATMYHGGALLSAFEHYGIGQRFNPLTGTPGHPAKAIVATSSLGKGNPAVNQLAGDTVATYPCDGMKDVYTAFYEGEVPAPFPSSDYTNFKRGASIFVLVRSGQKLNVSSVTLTDPLGKVASGKLVTHANDRNGNLDPSIVIFSPDHQLANSTQYHLRVVGTNNGVSFDKTVTFTTDATH
jgi:uncharacterized protein YkwD